MSCKMCDGQIHTLIDESAPAFPGAAAENYLEIDFQAPYIIAIADLYESQSMTSKKRLPRCPWCNKSFEEHENCQQLKLF